MQTGAQVTTLGQTYEQNYSLYVGMEIQFYMYVLVFYCFFVVYSFLWFFFFCAFSYQIWHIIDFILCAADVVHFQLDYCECAVAWQKKGTWHSSHV